MLCWPYIWTNRDQLQESGRGPSHLASGPTWASSEKLLRLQRPYKSGKTSSYVVLGLGCFSLYCLIALLWVILEQNGRNVGPLKNPSLWPPGGHSGISLFLRFYEHVSQIHLTTFVQGPMRVIWYYISIAVSSVLTKIDHATSRFTT